MKSPKPLLVGSILSGVVVAGLIGYAASAQSSLAGISIVDKIAQHFNLNKAEVQKVFDDNRQAKLADRETKYEARLTQAVTAGKLTSAQKDLVLAKHKELVSQLQSQKEALKDKTSEERRVAMQKQRDDIASWEKQNNIPTGYLGLFGPGFGGHHRGIGSGQPSDGI